MGRGQNGSDGHDKVGLGTIPQPVIGLALGGGAARGLAHGRMVEAMRAAYALPGIFSPVLIGDRWLVDGALVNPVPVSAARAMGAEIVIAANLSSDGFTHSTTIYSHGPAADISMSVVPEV